MISRFPSEETNEYKEVRGLVRGLELLRTLNSLPSGGASTSALAKACSIHRTTTKRLLETLRSQGMVELGSKDGFYLLSNSVLQLSSALHPVSWIHEVALPIMQEATGRLRWSCDIATYREGHMVVRESTQRWNALVGHRTLIGEGVPALHSALGRAYLAACGETLIEKLIGEVAQSGLPEADTATALQEVRSVIEATRARGYAIKDRSRMKRPHLGAVAVAIRGNGRAIGAINLVFENTSVTQARLDEYYVPELRAVAGRIEQAYQDWRAKNDMH